MASESYALEVRLRSSRGIVLLPTYRAVLDDIRFLLDEVDKQSKGTTGDDMQWGVGHSVAESSLVFRVRPFNTADDARTLRATSAVVQGVHDLEVAANIPAYFTETAVQRIGKLGNLRGKSGIDGLQIASVNGQVLDEADVNDQVTANAEMSVQIAAQDYGSVEGIVDSLAGGAKTKRAATVYDPGSKRGVRVQFDAGQSDLFRDAWGHRISVRGLITYNKAGQPMRIHADTVELLAEPLPRTRLRELIGIAPGWLGDQTVTEAMDEIRRRA